MRACCFKIDIFITMLINVSSTIDSMLTEVLSLAWSDCGGGDEDEGEAMKPSEPLRCGGYGQGDPLC